MPIVDSLRRLAAKKNATPPQLSFAWLLAEKSFIVPIPGTRNIDHLNENLGAINIQLTPGDLREIDTAFSTIESKPYFGRAYRTSSYSLVASSSVISTTSLRISV